MPTIESLIGKLLINQGLKIVKLWCKETKQCCRVTGENPLPPDDPNKEMMGKTEVSLILTNKFDVPGEANAETDAKTLLLKYISIFFFFMT